MWAVMGLTFSAFAATKTLQSLYYDPHINNIDDSRKRLRDMMGNDQDLLALIAEYEYSGLKNMPLQKFLDLMKRENSGLSSAEFDDVLDALKNGIQPMLSAEHEKFIAFSELIIRGHKKEEQLINGIKNIASIRDITKYDLIELYKHSGFVPSTHERFRNWIVKKYDAAFFRLDDYDETMRFYKVSSYVPRLNQNRETKFRKREAALISLTSAACVLTLFSPGPAQDVLEIHNRSQAHQLNLMRRGQR
jgi:hypothetical protein